MEQGKSAAHSGPQARRGKRSSKYNALRVGIFAKIVLSGGAFTESEQDYSELLSAWRKSIGPVDPFEEMVAEKLAFLDLRLTRVYKADAEVAPSLFQRVSETLEKNGAAAETEYIPDGKLVTIPLNLPPPDLLIRYEVSIERHIERTLNQLQRWRQKDQTEPSK